jgi:hypothetical protein
VTVFEDDCHAGRGNVSQGVYKDGNQVGEIGFERFRLEREARIVSKGSQVGAEAGDEVPGKD